MNTIKSLGRKRSNAEALSVVPLFSPFAQTKAFAQPVFFAPLSTGYKKTKGLLLMIDFHTLAERKTTEESSS